MYSEESEDSPDFARQVEDENTVNNAAAVIGFNRRSPRDVIGQQVKTMRSIIVLLLLFSSCFVQAFESGWEVSIHNNERAYLARTHQDGPSLNQAVETVPKDVWLRSFRVTLNDDDLVVQKELHEFLNLNYPDQLEEALRLGRSLPYAKAVALRLPLQEAIMASSLANEISSALASRCERIASSGLEKFGFWQKDGQLVVTGMVTISTGECI